MSYVRFGEDGSDVFVFVSDSGIECCLCNLQEREWVEDPSRKFIGGYLRDVGKKVPSTFRTNAEMVEHLNLHQAAGHTVPRYVFDRLNDPADQRRNRDILANTTPRSQE